MTEAVEAMAMVRVSPSGSIGGQVWARGSEQRLQELRDPILKPFAWLPQTYGGRDSPADGRTAPSNLFIQK